MESKINKEGAGGKNGDHFLREFKVVSMEERPMLQKLLIAAGIVFVFAFCLVSFTGVCLVLII